jgi:hypothetical protein
MECAGQMDTEAVLMVTASTAFKNQAVMLTSLKNLRYYRFYLFYPFREKRIEALCV